MKKNVMIAGGAGFVGSHLTDTLLQQGHHVRIFDNLNPQVHPNGAPSYLAPEADLMVGDVRDAESLGKAVARVDVVYHLASAFGVGQSMYEISNYMGANTQGTANLLQSLLDGGSNIYNLLPPSSISFSDLAKHL